MAATLMSLSKSIYCMGTLGFPNSDTTAERKRQMMARIRDKETNMKNRLERRRDAIWRKWASRLAWTCAVIVGVPIFITFATICWRLMLD